MNITNIKQGVKNPNRVNVFVNGKYSFSLDVSQVVEFKLKVGKELTPEQLAEYKNASEFGKLYQRTLEWVLMRPRSIRETRDYLQGKLRQYSSGRSSSLSSQGSSLIPRSDCGCPLEDCNMFLDEIIERLISKGYLDDYKFAEFWVQNRFVKKGVSRKRLSIELMKKGISRDIIDEVLNERDDEEEIIKIIAKKRTKYDDEKLISYLVRQGFSYQLAQSRVRDFGKD